MQSYVEIRNPDTEVVAASFIVTTALVDRNSRAVQPIPLTQSIEPGATMSLPAYAEPRTLNLTPVNTNVTLEELQASIPETESTG